MQKRYSYNLSHQVATFGKFGCMLPFCSLEVAPGDTFSGKVGMLTRLSPLKHALLTDIYIDSFMFYVPHRMVWSEWEQFLANGPVENPTLTPPTVSVGNKEFPALRYTNDAGNEISMSAFRLMAYNLVYNEYFRDDEQQPVAATAWPVDSDGIRVNAKKNFYSTIQEEVGYGQDYSAEGTENLGITQTSAVEILRAIAQQKIAMKRATYGTRYVDILRSYGINVNYQMLQRPEVVGVGRSIVNVTDVVATNSGAGLGTMAGHGVSGSRLVIKRKSFPEHGTLLGIVIARPDYQINGLADWFDNPRQYDSFYDPGLVPLPPREIYCSDLVPRWDDNRNKLIGYQPWGQWYRSAPSWSKAGLSNWIPDYRPTEPAANAANVDTFRQIAAGNFDNLFNDVSFGHFQLSAVNRLRALRLIPRSNLAAFSGTT